MPRREVDGDSFRLAVEASPAAMIMIGSDGLVRFANAETERMFGYAVDELIGKPIELLVPARLRGGHSGLRHGFFANPSKRPMGAGRDLNGRRKDGMEFPVEIGLTPIGAGAGTIVLATVLDITARRKAESDLARRANELERANERLAQFAYVASHDLQEPLRKIAAYAGLMEEALARSDAAEVTRATSVIATSAVRARQLVDNLLSFSRVAEGRSNVQPLDLREEIELVLSDLSESIQETAAQVRLDVPPIAIEADRSQFARLVQNIVSNAIKYRQQGRPPTIRISAARAGPSHARLTVADDGIGFDETYARDIFEPFKRLHDLQRYPGSGIGLAICKAIADRYGWTLSATSRVGEGSTFSVTFPTSPEADAAPPD